MEITNLEINILYFICHPQKGRARNGSVDRRDIFEAFSDIPEGSIKPVIDAMASDRLITVDTARSTVEITPTGVNRLQLALACRIHHFGRCGCGRPIEAPV
jgi:DNA-binding PadR family transcriptional regulator